METANKRDESRGVENQLFQFLPSFGPFLNYLREKKDQSEPVKGKFYYSLIRRFERYPQLLKPFPHQMIFEGYDDLIHLMKLAICPLVSDIEDIPIAFVLVQPKTFFFHTKHYKEMFLEEHVHFSAEEDMYNHLQCFVRVVLERCYGIAVSSKETFERTVYNNQDHTVRHYQVNLDTRFITINVVDRLPEYKASWIELLYLPQDMFFSRLANFPFSAFTIEGFIILQVENITERAAINHLKNAVINVFSDGLKKTMDKVELAIRELLNDSRIKVGLTPFFKVNGKIVYDESLISKAILVATTEECPNDRIPIQKVSEKFSGVHAPFILTAVDKSRIKDTHYLYGLINKNIGSYVAWPLYTSDGFSGVFELGSEVEGTFTVKTAEKMQPAMPLILDLLSFVLNAFDEKIEKVIKEKFTSIQPAVEWKFNEVAWEYLKMEIAKKPNIQIENVVFPGVYPLFGAIDIRDSSVHRNSASQKDYIVQLHSSNELLKKIAASLSLSLVDGLEYKTSRFLHEIEQELSTETELKVLDYFQLELNPFFTYVKSKYPEFAEAIEEYESSCDISTGAFYHYRKSYESSLQIINRKMSSYFEREVEHLQKIYSFYFEKYRTDGIEYNIYLGQSIVPEVEFEPVYLQNIKLWQISSMANVARLHHSLLPTLEIPLQVTYLIFVHSHPIDISFRKDERRFDVEGSYNIRYETIKKRLDKVHIKDTQERLTKPNYIAIVYSNPKEIDEYCQHIDYLIDKGLLLNQMETLELEEMQGVSGMKALRIAVNLEDH